MVVEPDSQVSSRRPPVRMDAQDGPWSVSVAETPHDVRSYSLYIKSTWLAPFIMLLIAGHRDCNAPTTKGPCVGTKASLSISSQCD